MLNRTIVPIALAALLLGGLPAAAAQRSHGGGEQKVKALVHDLQRATRHLYRDAAHGHHFNRWSHWGLMRAVRHLDAHARRFEGYVDRYGSADRRSQREFRELERAFHVAQLHAKETPYARSLRSKFRRVEHIVGRLDTRLASAHGRSAERDRHHRRWDDRYARLEWSFR